MKRTQGVLLWLLLLALAACASPSTTPTAVVRTRATATWPLATMAPMQGPTLALVNGTLIDGTGADPLPDAAVLIVQGRIMNVGPRSRVTIPADATVIDVAGGTILPGLINAHVHEGYDAAHLQAWAQAGVTTVRDLGASPSPDLFARRNSLRADPRNARLVAAGPFITVPEGYPIVPWGGRALTVTSVADAEAVTRHHLDDGADVIKISLEAGGTFGRKIPVLSNEEATAIVRVAHERGTRVSAHITGASDVSRCLAAGVDDIAHIPGDYLYDKFIAQVVQAGMYWVPTLELWHLVQPSMGQQAVDNLRRFVAAGGTVALGTDYAGYSAVFDLGLPIREMEWMQEAGMTPMQIIVAATRNAAWVCNVGRELGTIEVGKIADVLVVNGDPLQDMHALQDVRTVIHNGQVIR
jgi:imidazolonepropionase-like amidohydrolase